MSLLDLVGDAFGYLLGLEGMDKDEAQVRRALQLQQMWREEDIEREDERFNREFGQRIREFSFLRADKRREWEWLEDNRNFQRGMGAINNFVGFLEKEPALKNNFMNAWKVAK